MSQFDAFRQKVTSCWRQPVDFPNPERYAVQVRVSLDRDGRIVGEPVASRSAFLRGDDVFYQAAVRNAVDALKACQPYDMLPPESYEYWKDTVVDFTPMQF